jgi:hypothetical protein
MKPVSFGVRPDSSDEIIANRDAQVASPRLGKKLGGN